MESEIDKENQVEGSQANINILSAFPIWQESKCKWFNIKSGNEQPIERPTNSSLTPSQFGTVLFPDKQNFGTSVENHPNANEYFASHLLLIHQLHCAECYVSKANLDATTATAPKNDRKLKNKKEIQAKKKKETESPSFISSLRKRLSQGIKSDSRQDKREISEIQDDTQKSSKPPSVSSNSGDIPSHPDKKLGSTEDGLSSTDSYDTDDSMEGKTDENEAVGFDVFDDDAPNSDSNEKEDSATVSTSGKTKNGRKPFKCQYCNRLFPRPGKLENHIQAFHEGKKFQCEICKKEYLMASTLKTHMLTHTENPIECKECGKKITSSFALKTHMRRTHGSRKIKFKCEDCGKGFHLRNLLKSHRLVHTNERNFACEVCGKSFKSRESLRNHSLIHKGGKLYPCNVCGATFKHHCLLYRHKKKDHGAMDQLCSICGKAFHIVSQLKRHALTHSDEPHYKCDQCGKGYRSESGLQSHMNTHKEHLPNICHFCGKAFVSQSNMSKHIARHKGIKHHFCSSCDKGFLTKQELRAHVKVHGDKESNGALRRSKLKNSQNHRGTELEAQNTGTFRKSGADISSNSEQASSYSELQQPETASVPVTLHKSLNFGGYSQFVNFDEYRCF